MTHLFWYKPSLSLPSLPNFHPLNLLSLVRRAVQVSHVTIALTEPQTHRLTANTLCAVATTEMNGKLVLNEEMLPGGMQNSRCKCVGAVDDSVMADKSKIRAILFQFVLLKQLFSNSSSFSAHFRSVKRRIGQK